MRCRNSRRLPVSTITAMSIISCTWLTASSAKPNPHERRWRDRKICVKALLSTTKRWSLDLRSRNLNRNEGKKVLLQLVHEPTLLCASWARSAHSRSEKKAMQDCSFRTWGDLVL